MYRIVIWIIIWAAFWVALLAGLPKPNAQQVLTPPLHAPGSISAAGELQQSNNDMVNALRQQREEAQDKLTNAYVVIMKLQREVDRLKAAAQAAAAPPKEPDAPPATK